MKPRRVSISAELHLIMLGLDAAARLADVAHDEGTGRISFSIGATIAIIRERVRFA